MSGTTYTWHSWSDGGAISHTILAKGTSNYTAVYLAPGEEPPKEEPSTGGGTSGGSSGTTSPPSGGTEPPQTKLGRHPTARSTKTTATFIFSATVGGATFRCKLDGKPIKSCHSPQTYRNLKPGHHTFKVWSTIGVLKDPTPAKFTWKILSRH